MSDHGTALVPLEAWCYASPELLAAGKSVDLGLFAESLIYYDSVLANPTTQQHFAAFLQWFTSQGHLADFIALVRDGTIKIYDYSFATSAINDEVHGTYVIMNIQDPIQSQPSTFEQRFLYHKDVEAALPPKARHRQKIYEALRGNVIEAKANDFGNPVENARSDYKNPRRMGLIVQAFVDELYQFKKLGRAPDIEAKIVSHPGGDKHSITLNIDLFQLANSVPELGFHLGVPLTATAHSNRLIWSAALQGCDLYLPGPMSVLVGDKLYESANRIGKTGNIIEELKAEVEFPDVRELVNAGKLQLSDVLAIRKKARRFRDWLQTESDRDRNAIIAYHNEVARESGFTKGVRTTLKLFGVIGGGVAGAIGSSVAVGPLGLAPGATAGIAVGAAVGATAGGAVTYVADVAAKLGKDWKPVAFGNWMRDRIEKVLQD